MDTASNFLMDAGPFIVPHHIDWSERRHHLARSLGAALAKHLIDLKWVKRTPSSRAIHITENGRKSLADKFGLCL